FYSAALDLPKVRYLYVTSVDPTKTSEFFYRLGLILGAGEFCGLPDRMPEYEKRLRDWGLPTTSPVGTMIVGDSPSALAAIISCSPSSDFFLPAAFRQQALEAVRGSHTPAPDEQGRFFLLSNSLVERPPGIVSPGTLEEY